VVVPDTYGSWLAASVAPLSERHNVITIPVEGLEQALRACPVPLSTMGRGLDADLAYFLTAAAAGRHAGRLLDGGSD